MSEYRAPLAEMEFLLKDLAGLDQVCALPGFEEASPDVASAILEEASKFANEVLDPINWPGDQVGAKRNDDGTVTTAPGFKDAYLRFCENGWLGLNKNPEFGGQGLPQLLATAVEEMWHSANLAFDLCPMLTAGAIEAIELNGSDELKQKFLPNMVSGKWTGTMNLTEPNAGSDLAAVRSRAVPQGDGTYLISGQKIFITYGEHDYTENIIHLVLARTPDAPPGVKGISLFVVPKFLVNDDGSLGARNDAYCASIEHKLGIHASPTAVMAFGDKTGAIGYVVGEENRGLEYMFVMMNLARFAVGMEGIGVSERSYQRAVAYARDRVQGKAVGLEKGAPVGPIIQHPDIRRMLMSMRAYTEAIRAVAYVTAAAFDNAHSHPDAAARAKHQAFVDFMIPIVKGHSTEVAQEVTSLGVQIHGGMGYIEETGAAQYFRDARITTIYEGTTGIQANDLIGRKTARDGGAVAKSIIADIAAVAAELSAQSDATLQGIGARLSEGVATLTRVVDWLVPMYRDRTRVAHAGAVSNLKLWGLVTGGWQLGRGALVASKQLAAGTGSPAFLKAKIATANYYALALLPQVDGLARNIMESGETVDGLADDQF